MDFDKKLQKYEHKFTDISDKITNLIKNRYNVLFNGNQVKCECNTSFLINDLNIHYKDKYHKYYIKDELKRLKLLQYIYYIKRNRLMDNYFLNNKN